MPKVDLKLPSDETVTFFFLREWPNLADMIYLRSELLTPVPKPRKQQQRAGAGQGSFML